MCFRDEPYLSPSSPSSTHSSFPPSKLTLQLFPIDKFVGELVAHSGHNPRLQITFHAKKPISYIVNHLMKKWNIKSTDAIRLFPPNDGQHEGWGFNDNTTALSISVMLGSPPILQLYYKCELNRDVIELNRPHGYTNGDTNGHINGTNHSPIDFSRQDQGTRNSSSTQQFSGANQNVHSFQNPKNDPPASSKSSPQENKASFSTNKPFLVPVSNSFDESRDGFEENTFSSEEQECKSYYHNFECSQTPNEPDVEEYFRKHRHETEEEDDSLLGDTISPKKLRHT